MKFIDTKRFSPVVYGGDVPHEDDLFHRGWDELPLSDKDAIKFIREENIIVDTDWWRKQYDRCINGYTVKNAVVKGGDAIPDGIEAQWFGKDCHLTDYDITFQNGDVHISGRYYFFLNFWKMYGKLDGKKHKGVRYPKFLDFQFLMSLRVENMFRYEKDGQELKGRQIGMSEEIAGLICGYNYTFLESSVNLIVGGTSVDSEHTMENTIRGLDMLRNTQFFLKRKRGGDSKKKIVSKATGSMVESITALDNDQALSRYSPTAVVYEEIGKGKKKWSLGVASFVEPSLNAEGTKTGYQWFIGTGGEMEDGVYDLEQRHYNPESYNILSFPRRHTEVLDLENKRVGHVIPKWFFQVTDEDGNTLKNEGIKELKKLAAAKKNDEERWRFWTQHPIFDEQIFMSNTAGFFGKEVITNLNRRKILLQNRRELQITRRGRLEPIDPGKPFKGVKFIEDNEDWWIKITEEPEIDKATNSNYIGLYKAGTDSYDQDEAATSSSKGAFYIRKGFRQGSDSPHYNTYVAQIVERPTVAEGGAEVFYRHTALACIYYSARNNIEYRNTRIFHWYIDHRFEVLLKERPQLAFANMIKRSMVSNKYGTDASLKIPGLAITKDALTPDFIDRMFFIEQVDALSKFKLKKSDGSAYNCDITMATMEVEITAKDEEMITVKSKSQLLKRGERKGSIIYVRNNKGHIIQKII